MLYDEQEQGQGQGQGQGTFERGYCKGEYMLVGMVNID